MYKHIIWDFDGTLFDTYPIMVQLFVKALEDLGIEESAELILELMKVSELYLMEYCQKTYRVDERLKLHYDLIRKDAELESAKPFPHIKNICEGIYRTGGKNYLYTHRGKSSIELLKRSDLYGYFHDFVTKENRFKRKPHPEALLYLMEKNDIPKGLALMIGDRDIDLQAGKNAGIHTCYFSNGASSYSQFADHTIKDFRELPYLMGV